jgi:hypothetical protein
MFQHLYQFISELTYNFISLDILDVIQLLFLVFCRLVPFRAKLTLGNMNSKHKKLNKNKEQ